jgi:hypothetical protein
MSDGTEGGSEVPIPPQHMVVVAEGTVKTACRIAPEPRLRHWLRPWDGVVVGCGSLVMMVPVDQVPIHSMVVVAEQLER